MLILRNDGDAPTSAPAGTTSPTVPTPRKAKIGSLAPDFRGRDLSGNEVDAVVVAAAARWCSRSSRRGATLARRRCRACSGFSTSTHGRLAVLGVNYRDIDDDTRAFVQRLGVTFPAVIEDTADNPIAARYDVHEMPDTIFIDAKGVVRDRTWGPLSDSDLRAAVNRLTAG